MATLLQFDGAACEEATRPYSFALSKGETRVLRVASEAEKDAVIGAVLGKRKCGGGAILLQGAPLEAGRSSGRVGWVAANGGLISNLKIWENVTLPLWYHGRHTKAETEQQVARWLSVLGMAEEEWEKFMETTPDRLSPWQRKLAGLLRGLVQMPLLLMVDAALFKGNEPRTDSLWTAALEEYAVQGGTVLAVADGETVLPWKTIA